MPGVSYGEFHGFNLFTSVVGGTSAGPGDPADLEWQARFDASGSRRRKRIGVIAQRGLDRTDEVVKEAGRGRRSRHAPTYARVDAHTCGACVKPLAAVGRDPRIHFRRACVPSKSNDRAISRCSCSWDVTGEISPRINPRAWTARRIKTTGASGPAACRKTGRIRSGLGPCRKAG